MHGISLQLHTPFLSTNSSTFDSCCRSNLYCLLPQTQAVLCCVCDVQELESAGLLASAQNPTPPRFEWQVLGKLAYLQACIREGLRLFPPAAQGSFRLCTTADININKQLTLPKVGNVVLLRLQ